MKKLQRLDFIPLRARIVAGFFIFSLLFLFIAALIYWGVEKGSGYFDAYQQISEQTSLRIRIGRDVVEMQHHSQFFAQNGHVTHLDKVEALRTLIQQGLDAASKADNDKQDQMNIDNMKEHLSVYAKAFRKVIKERRLRQELVQNQLLKLANEAEERLHLDYYGQRSLKNEANLVGLLAIEKNAVRYFDSLDSSLVDRTRNYFKNIYRDIDSQLQADMAVEEKESVRQTKAMIREYEHAFFKAVQSTRAYLYLVNVVMAGEASELLYHADFLKSKARLNLDRVQVKLGTLIRQTEYMMIAGIFAALLVGISISILLGRSIVTPITDLTETFRQLAKGNTETETPYDDYRDEIGDLSRAADVFKNKNLREGELLREKMEAEQLTVAKGEFLARMSHEIRTPMNAVLGLSQLALRTDLSMQQRDYLSKINSSSRVLMGIINDILDFSKIESGKLELERITFKLDDVIDNLLHLFSTESEKKGVKFILDIDHNISAYLIGDPLRLGQVLINLVGNAFKFTSQGEVSVAIEGVKISHQQQTIRFSVCDSGIGIDEKDKPLLFQAFSQADGSISRRFGGTGLGLSISSQIVELMGGMLQVESDGLGQGSTFSFDIEFAVVSHSLPTPSDEDSALHTNSLKDIRGARVLLVDDHSINQQVATELLEQVGLELDIATNGLEAVEKVLSGSYDLVFMDMQMPVMDGLEATRKIREAGLDALPVIAMTANVLPRDRERSIEAGMNDYLSKPIDPDALERLLLRWLAPARHKACGNSESRLALTEKADLAVIEGLDSTWGISRVGGSEEVYIKILGQFITGAADDICAVRTAMELGHDHEAERILHSLKGASDSLGAVLLGKMVRKVESALHDGNVRGAMADLPKLEKAISALSHELGISPVQS